MRNKEFGLRNKEQIIHLFEKYSGDKSVTVEELLNIFKGEVDKRIESIELNENKVLEDFKDVYLKKLSTDKEYYEGGELEVIHIDSLKLSSYTEDYERCYLLSGEKIMFSKINVHHRKFDNTVYSSKTEKELRNFVKITKEEYFEYLEKYNQLNNLIINILK